MDPKAVEKAKSRLRVAQKATGELENCSDFDAFSDTWYTFLTASKNIYTVLEQGAKVSAQSRQWYGAKAALRRGDDLLQYLYEARNDDEHGLGAIAEHVESSLMFGMPGPDFSKAMYVEEASSERISVTSLDGKPIGFAFAPAHAKLLEIHARGDRVLPPPQSHLGKALPDSTPLTVAKTALAYLVALVDEASALA